MVPEDILTVRIAYRERLFRHEGLSSSSCTIENRFSGDTLYNVLPLLSLGSFKLRLTVIIPTLNEEECIGEVLDEIHAALGSSGMTYEVMIVDGMSKDRTREIASSKSAQVVEEPRKGYGRAYKTGFEMAKGEVIATLDGDCTYPADMIIPLMKQLDDENLEFITTDRFGHMEAGRDEPNAQDR